MLYRSNGIIQTPQIAIEMQVRHSWGMKRQSATYLPVPFRDCAQPSPQNDACIEPCHLSKRTPLRWPVDVDRDGRRSRPSDRRCHARDGSSHWPRYRGDTQHTWYRGVYATFTSHNRKKPIKYQDARRVFSLTAN